MRRRGGLAAVERRLPLASRLVFWFAFLGPIGSLVPLPGVPTAFRFYYLMLVPGIVILLAQGMPRRAFHHLLIVAPLLTYMMVSAVYAYVAFAGFIDASEGNPLVRFALFLCLLVFTMLAGEQARRFTLARKLKVVSTFMNGYLISLVAGYIFFAGFYAHLFSLEFLARFEVLVQMGFGLLRFSPGSYPNEYGVVSSFALAVLTLLLVYRKDLRGTDPIFRRIQSTPWLILWFLLTLAALFLATTRAAYISYLVSVLYIGMSQGGLRKPLVFLARTIGAGALLLLCVQPFFDVIGILAGGYRAFFDQNAFANGRINAWRVALAFFMEHPYLGVGFGFVDMMHNVYLQLLFGLGIAGTCLLMLTALVLFLRSARRRPKTAPAPPASGQLLLVRISTVALIHVLWFAMGNHNLNHFLTWFAVLLAYMRGESGLTEPAPSPSAAATPTLLSGALPALSLGRITR